MNHCSCAKHADGTVTTFLCPIHADSDPCATMASVTGRRRKGAIVRGVCSNCWWRSPEVARRAFLPELEEVTTP